MFIGVNKVVLEEIPVWWSSLEGAYCSLEFQAAWNKISQNLFPHLLTPLH